MGRVQKLRRNKEYGRKLGCNKVDHSHRSYLAYKKSTVKTLVIWKHCLQYHEEELVKCANNNPKA